MPKVLERTVYAFAELDDGAKENARQWWRDLEAQDFDTDYVIEDAQRMGALLGIEFSTQSIPLMSGKTRQAPRVYWSGFSSQGDGACFEGHYRYAKGAAKSIRKEAPQDTELHRIADALQSAQRKAFYRLEASCSHRGHYYHSGCMSVSVNDSEAHWRDIPEGAEEAITQALRDFADWIYRQLEAEYEYRMSDENVDESIEINGYLFDENGRPD